MDYTYSFIIPHHNSPELLNRCLDSIPERDDIQIIVVDDNSEEKKKPIVNRPDVEIVYIDSVHTKGAGHARNVGIAHAKGQWLFFADCDDYYSIGFISVLDQYKDNDIDVLYFNYDHYDSLKSSFLPDGELQKRIQGFDGNKQDLEFVKFRNNTPWNKMISRKYILAHRMYYEEVPNGNDVLFSLFLASYSNRVLVIPYRLYCYVKTPDSIGTKKQSDLGLKCRISHFVKHSAFNNSLSHPEWNSTIWHYLSLIYKRNGFIQLMKLLPFILKVTLFDKQIKKEWIEIIDRHK